MTASANIYATQPPDLGDVPHGRAECARCFKEDDKSRMIERFVLNDVWPYSRVSVYFCERCAPESEE